MENYKFHHVHYNSRDPLKTAEFYEKMFGAVRSKVQEEPEGDRMKVELILDGTLIIISTPWDKNDPNTRFGLDHIGLETDNLEAAVAELKDQGLEFELDITTVPDADISFLRAPDDTLIEVLQIKK